MAARLKYRCNQCSSVYVKPEARCSRCGEWGSIQQEEANIEKKNSSRAKSLNIRGISEINLKSDDLRYQTGIEEVDLVLGGGFSPGSVVLLAGAPGIGKSTLILQIAHGLKIPVIYLTGEESVEQVASRAHRLNTGSDNIKIAYCTDLQQIIGTMHDHSEALVIVDSIQTVNNEETGFAASGPAFIRAVAQELCEAAKTTGTNLLVVGHITKDGNVAGPKYLEHLVDVVLTLDHEDSGESLRILRGLKNRYGSTDDVGLLRMTQQGFQPADFTTFLSQDHEPGIARTISSAGTRLIPAEIQALVTKSYGEIPRRVCFGLDYTRVQLIMAVLEKHCQIPWWQYDVHISTTGGLTVKESFADLAIATALMSSLNSRPAPGTWIGEIQLTGRVRNPEDIQRRRAVAESLGFKKITDANNLKHCSTLKDNFL